MMNQPLVSIALCTYNGTRYLQQQMDTLVNQTYPHLEIIVTDDGSSDDTFLMLEQYAQADQRIRLHRNERNLGYVKNFEKAIGLCQGPYIALADQDDIWDLNKIETLLQHIGDAMLIYHDSEFIDNEGLSLGKMSGIINMYSGANPLAFLFYNSVSGHSCLFKSELVSHLGSFDRNFYHDWWIAFVAANVGRVAYLDIPLVKYRQHPQANTDILRIKKETDKPKKRYAEMNIPWLEHCSRLNGKCQGVINDILKYYRGKGFINALKFMRLLFKHAHELYFVKKKSHASKLNYIRKMVFHKRDQYFSIDEP